MFVGYAWYAWKCEGGKLEMPGQSVSQDSTGYVLGKHIKALFSL